jgi:hypothetical protein
METERARTTQDRVKDHLYARGFRDETGMLYVHTVETYDGKVLISLFPHHYDCETCRAKGFVPKLVEAFKQRLSPTWCTDCQSLTDQRWERLAELTPRLKAALELAFTVIEVSPGSQFTSFIIVP